MTAPAPPFDLDAWRARVPLLERLVPLNHCSQAPQTDATRAAAEEYLGSWSREGMAWDRWLEEVEGARREFAALLGAAEEDVAVSTSVSAATAGLASAIDWSAPRAGLVLSEAEFPSVAHVWSAQARRGAALRWVPVRDGVLRLDDWDAAIDAGIRWVSATHAYYRTGFRQDVAAIAGIARERGARVFVDAYQTLGTGPVDVEALGIDALASGTLKYLLGVPGIAFLWVRREVADTLEPTVTGWFGRVDPFAFDARRLDWAAGARRFEIGTPPLFEAYVSRAGIALLREVGLEAVEAWTRVLSRRLAEGGEARGLRLLGTGDPARKTPTTAFRVPGHAHAAEAALRRRGFLASARGDAIRLAPHFYNTPGEIDRALDALVEIVEEG